jgi:hypothetical protein
MNDFVYKRYIFKTNRLGQGLTVGSKRWSRIEVEAAEIEAWK